MSGESAYVSRVHSKYSVRPVFPLGTQLAIGDVGTLGNGVRWDPVGSLRDIVGAEPEDLRPEPPNEDRWSLDSGDDVKFRVFASGETSDLFKEVANAKVRTEVTLGKSDSFTFGARNVSLTTAHELNGVLRRIRFAYHTRRDLPQEQQWNKDFVYVFALANAEAYTAIIAEQDNTTVAVEVKGEVALPQAPVGLAVEVEFTAASRSYQHFSAAPTTSCFFRAFRLDPSIFRGWEDEHRVEALTEMSAEDVEAVWDSYDLPDPDEAFVQV